jgi:hypothetical protein
VGEINSLQILADSEECLCIWFCCQGFLDSWTAWQWRLPPCFITHDNPVQNAWTSNSSINYGTRCPHMLWLCRIAWCITWHKANSGDFTNHSCMVFSDDLSNMGNGLTWASTETLSLPSIDCHLLKTSISFANYSLTYNSALMGFPDYVISL